MSKLCISCGFKLNDEDVFCTSCGTKQVTNKVENNYCTSCGKKIDNGALFCTGCGKKISDNNVVISEQKKPELPVPVMVDGKFKSTAGMLAIFLGIFGAHNFYLQNYFKAILQLFLTVLSLFIFTPMTFLWGITEGILIFSGVINKDGTGKEIINS